MKRNKKPLFFLICCFVILLVLQLITPKPIDWRPTYKRKDKIPYGMNAFYTTLPLLFPNQPIENKAVSIYNSLINQSYKKTTYVIINQRFSPDKLDVRELLNFVEDGNTVFIASSYFNEVFRDTMKFEVTYFYNTSEWADEDTTQGKKKFDWQECVNLNFYNPLLKREKGYTIATTENSYFYSFDTVHAKVLGNVNRTRANFIKIHFGKGDFFISTSPEAFINYNFVNKENAEYASKVLSYLPQQHIIWDDYYKKGNVREGDALTVIMSKPALATAYHLLIGSVLLFILIGIKRKQRIIPVIEPFKNSTLDFVTTIGTLYYQNGSHKEIAEKQINHFLSFIHGTFRVDISQFDNQMISKVANRSGIEPEKVNRIFTLISLIRSKREINEHELLQLNAMIEDFYKQNRR